MCRLVVGSVDPLMRWAAGGLLIVMVVVSARRAFERDPHAAVLGIAMERCDAGGRSGRNRLLVAIEAVHLAVPRRQADGVADLMPVVAEDPRRQHPDLRNLDVEYGVGA
jgi:hypothetical protein